MIKKDIAKELVNRTDLSASQSTQAVQGVIDIIADALVCGETIQIRGFGTIKKIKRAAKLARDINKGTFVNIPEHNQIKIFTSAIFHKRINESK